MQPTTPVAVSRSNSSPGQPSSESAGARELVAGAHNEPSGFESAPRAKLLAPSAHRPATAPSPSAPRVAKAPASGPMTVGHQRAALARLLEDAQANAEAGLRAHLVVASWLAAQYERNLDALAPRRAPHREVSTHLARLTALAHERYARAPMPRADEGASPSSFAAEPHADANLRALEEALDSAETVLASLRVPCDVVPADLVGILASVSDEFLFPLRMEPLVARDLAAQLRPDARRQLLELSR